MLKLFDSLTRSAKTPSTDTRAVRTIDCLEKDAKQMLKVEMSLFKKKKKKAGLLMTLN